jgi:hypothetical protein
MYFEAFIELHTFGSGIRPRNVRFPTNLCSVAYLCTRSFRSRYSTTSEHLLKTRARTRLAKKIKTVARTADSLLSVCDDNAALRRVRTWLPRARTSSNLRVTALTSTCGAAVGPRNFGKLSRSIIQLPARANRTRFYSTLSILL